MAKQTKWGVGEKHTGPRAIFNPPDVPEVGFYALTDDGKELLKRNGKPVRLVQVDLAPDDNDDGKEEYRIAGKNHPAQTTRGSVVELEFHGEGAGGVGIG